MACCHQERAEAGCTEVECKAVVYQLELFRTDTTKAGSSYREPEVYETKNKALDQSDILQTALTDENWKVRVVPCPVF